MKKNVLALSISAMFGGLGFASRRENTIGEEFLSEHWMHYLCPGAPPQPMHSAHQQLTTQKGANHD